MRKDRIAHHDPSRHPSAPRVEDTGCVALDEVMLVVRHHNDDDHVGGLCGAQFNEIGANRSSTWPSRQPLVILMRGP